MNLVAPDSAVLWAPAAAATDDDRVTHQHTIDELAELMLKIGAAGLAFPQIGVPLCIFVSQSKDWPVVINPQWIAVIGCDFISKPERSLTHPQWSGYIRRPAKIHATWEGKDGAKKSADLEAMDARIFLHLCDYLLGKPIFPKPLIH